MADTEVAEQQPDATDNQGGAPDDWFQQLMAVHQRQLQFEQEWLARMSGMTAPVVKPSVWHQPDRPWWAPDLPNMVAIAIVIITGVALFYRMTHPSEINDKLLDMMLTILFGTAFVALVNFVYGSSRSSQAKDDRASAVVDKLLPVATNDKEPH